MASKFKEQRNLYIIIFFCTYCFIGTIHIVLLAPTRWQVWPCKQNFSQCGPSMEELSARYVWCEGICHYYSARVVTTFRESLLPKHWLFCGATLSKIVWKLKCSKSYKYIYIYIIIFLKKHSILIFHNTKLFNDWMDYSKLFFYVRRSHWNNSILKAIMKLVIYRVKFIYVSI